MLIDLVVNFFSKSGRPEKWFRLWEDVSFFRDLLSPQETLNCDLSDDGNDYLDPYNSEHFLVDALSDFYTRLRNCQRNGDVLMEKISQSVGNDVSHSISVFIPPPLRNSNTQKDWLSKLECFDFSGSPGSLLSRKDYCVLSLEWPFFWQKIQQPSSTNC